MLLNFQSFGEGRPLLILHGLFGSARNWQGIARALSKEHYIITPDLRNHGQSFHDDSMSYIDMANDVVALTRQLKLNNTILIGHSMGGKVAMTALLSEPGLFDAMIAVDIAPVSYTHNFTPIFDAMKSLDITTITNRNMAETHLKKQIRDQGTRQLILQNLIRSDKGFTWRINLPAIESNMTNILSFPQEMSGRNCHLPCLFLGGAESNYIQSIHNPAIFQHFPAAEIKMFENAGHWLHVDKPTDFLKETKTFINYI